MEVVAGPGTSVRDKSRFLHHLATNQSRLPPKALIRDVADVDYSAMEANEYAWICGGNIDVSHRRLIGSGGYGDVHEVCPEFVLILTTDVFYDY